MQVLNELQAYILVYRWSKQHNNIVPEASDQLLQELQSAFFLERIHLLRSLECLLLNVLTYKVQTPTLVTHVVQMAVDDKLDTNLCHALTSSLDSTPPMSLTYTLASVNNQATNLMTVSEVVKAQRRHCQRQALLEQDLLLNLLMSLCQARPCSADCFTELMPTLHRHVFCLWAAGGEEATQKKSVACAVSLLSH